MHKLQHYGISGNTHSWITSFLTNRNQQVVIDGECSTKVSVTSGIPQGSVLGPTLFLLFINDLPDHLKSETRLLADDCLIYRHDCLFCHATRPTMQHCPMGQRLHEAWSSMRKNVTLLVLKDSHIYFYQVNGHVLKGVSLSPHLKVLLSEDLTFSSHISNITKKASRMLRFLCKNLSGCPVALKEMAFFSLVRSNLE